MRQELRSVLSEGKTPTALRSLDLPTLDLLLKEAGTTRDGLVEVLQQAIEAIGDPVYRAAAKDLFPLPYSDMGWLKLSVRGQRAAARFDIGYDAFRRGTGDRPSRMDDVVRRVAVSVTAVLDKAAEAENSSSGSENEEEPPAEHARAETPLGAEKFKPIAVVVLVVVVVVLIAAAVVARRGSQDPSGAPTAVHCSGTVGALDAELRREPAADRLSARLRAVFDRAGRDGTAGCPTGPAYRWQKLVVQEMGREGVPNGVLLASPNDVDVYLNRAAWGSYHQIGGKDGSAAQAMGGLIVQVVEFNDGHVEIELSTGTLLLAERSDAPYFWIPAPFVQWWRNHPELGLPTSNPLPSARQEFQHGVGIVIAGRAGDPVVRLVERPGDELPTLESIRGRILRQADATAWLIDDEGRRLWVPDGGTWKCLGGDARRVGGDFPGYAIATLPFGGQAFCPR